jgi:hypothetical protein
MRVDKKHFEKTLSTLLIQGILKIGRIQNTVPVAF